MKKFFLVFFVLCSIHFWRYDYFTQTFFNLTDIVSLLVMGYFFFSTFQNTEMRFKSPIIIYLVGLFCNILSAYFNNGQEIRDTALSLFPYYFILFYFFLHANKIERQDLEIVVITFAILYSVFYLLQDYSYPKRIFDAYMFRNRGTLRIRLEGNGFLMLSYFLLLNRYLLNHKLKDLLLALFFFAILLKGGFRTLTAGAILLTGVQFLKAVKYSVINYVLIILAVIFFIGLLQVGNNEYIINSMIRTSQKQQEEGDRYIRVMLYDYFVNEYPKNFSYYIFGGGFPGGRGDYSNSMGFLVMRYGFYWVDLGLIGFYFVVGLISMLGIFWYTLKGIFIKLPTDCFYLNLYFGYLLIVSFTTAEIFRDGIFVVEAIALYLIDLSLNEKTTSYNKYS